MKNVLCVISIALSCAAWAQAAPAKPALPAGAEIEWDVSKAWRIASEKRERVCINGLWRFRSEPSIREYQTVLNEGFEDSSLPEWERSSSPKQGRWSSTCTSTDKRSGKSCLLLDFDLPLGANFYHFHRTIPAKAETTYRISAFFKADLKSGTVSLEVQDARGYKVFTKSSDKMGHFPRWKEVSFQFTTPKGTEALRIYVRHYGAEPIKGTVRVDDIVLDERQGVRPGELVLPSDDQWGFLKVPGTWLEGKGYQAHWHPRDPGKGKGRRVMYAWYEREARIPRSWQGRDIFLRLGKVSTDAYVYCNGRLAGTVGYMGGMVAITEFVEPGVSARLTILVMARDPQEILATMGGERMRWWPPYRRGLSHRGLAGNVYVESRPASGPRVGPFLIMTSVTDKNIAVRIDLEGNGGARAGRAQAVCEVRDGQDVVKTFAARVPKGAGQVTVSSPWETPVLWEPDRPKLYSMVVKLVRGGVTIDASLPERFGFREFEIRGKYFYLNGVKINLFPASVSGSSLSWASRSSARRWLRKTRAEGHNFVYAGTADFPGMAAWVEPFLDAADEMGMLTAVTPAKINLFWDKLDQPEVWRTWREVTRTRLVRDWNRPSLVLWRMNMNLGSYHQDQNPLLLDGSLVPAAGSAWARKTAAAYKSNTFVEDLDPTRKTYNHACGDGGGSIYTLNNYLCWPQMQDLREWLHVWARSGSKPLMMVEFDLPYPGSFSMLDPTSWWRNEPLMSEYGAILLGEQSYALEDDDYVKFTDLAWNRGKKQWESAYGYYCSAFPPILDECSFMYYGTVVPAWRTWGISGGVNSWENTGRRLVKRTAQSRIWTMRERVPDVKLTTDWEHLQRPGFVPDVFVYPRGGGGEVRCHFDPGLPAEKEYIEPTRRRQVMQAVHRPLYAYIAGAGDDWPAQDHAFYSGERISKSVVLINDLRTDARFTVKWRARVDGRSAAEGSGKAVVAPAETGRVDFAFRAPRVTRRNTAVISVQVTVNAQELPVKPFAIQVYPKPTPVRVNTRRWVLYDPVGKTRAALRTLGVRIPSIQGDALPDGSTTLIVGREALGASHKPSFLSQLGRRLKQGYQVVVFEQTGEALQDLFSLRTITRGARQVWIRDRASRLVTGLINEDLADWRGKTTLGPIDGPPQSAEDSQRYKFVWRCSQRGTVASTIVEKPHAGNVRSIVDCEFDLRYTALWEVLEGRGRWMFCQLDVSDRAGRDPVADMLLANLITDVATWTATPQKQAIIVGAKEARADIDALGVAAHHSPQSCPAAGRDHVLVLVEGCAVWLNKHIESVKVFVRDGGHAVAVGLTIEDARVVAQACDGAFVTREDTLSKNLLKGPLPEVLRGVGPAEVHWREPKQVVVVSSVREGGWRSDTGVLAWAPMGAGGIVWIAAAPSDFDPERRPDLVFTRVNTSRLIAQVLTNLGVRCSRGWSACLTFERTEHVALPKVWRARRDPRQIGKDRGWASPDTDESSREWRDMPVPGMWEQHCREWASYDGDVWYRVRFTVPIEYRKYELEFFAGAIDDTDEVFLNGRQIGQTTTATQHWWDVERHYPVPAGLLKFGKELNVLAVRINDHFQNGGFTGPVQLRLPGTPEERSPVRHYLDTRVPRDNPYAYMRW